MRSYLRGDEAVVDEGRRLHDDVHGEARGVEDGGFLLLARHQPMGGDLRRIVALLRMCVNLDRAAALLRHVGETRTLLDPDAFDSELRATVVELSDRSAAIFRGGVDAWRAKDALAVNELDSADEAVDRLQELLLDSVSDRTDLVDERLMLGLLARYLERIADHGVAIARDTAFVVSGERVVLPSKVR